MIAGIGDWSASQLTRHRKVDFGANISAYVAAPEDVILGKLIYYRDGGSEKHLRDIRGIVKITGEELDQEYLDLNSAQLNVADIWKSLVADLDVDKS